MCTSMDELVLECLNRTFPWTYPWIFYMYPFQSVISKEMPCISGCVHRRAHGNLIHSANLLNTISYLDWPLTPGCASRSFKYKRGSHTVLMSRQDETTPQLSLGKQVFHGLVHNPLSSFLFCSLQPSASARTLTREPDKVRLCQALVWWPKHHVISLCFPF